MKLIIVDMDKDGDNDVVVAGKTGPVRLLQHGHGSATAAEQRLPQEETYPSWIPWATTASQPSEHFCAVAEQRLLMVAP